MYNPMVSEPPASVGEAKPAASVMEITSVSTTRTIAVYSSANRDETVFENPDEFDLDRPNIDKHLAFGLGPHRCAGVPLARMMLRVTLDALLKQARITGVEEDIVMTRWPEWGVLSASIKLVPTGRQKE